MCNYLWTINIGIRSAAKKASIAFVNNNPISCSLMLPDASVAFEARLEEILTCALRNHHDSMAPLKDPLFEGSQQTAASVQTK